MLTQALQTNRPQITIKGVDVTLIIKSLSLTESLFEPVLKGSFVTLDTAGSRLYQVTGALGDLNPIEFSFFSLKDNSPEKSIRSKDFLIYKIEPGSTEGTTNSFNVGYFASKPMFINQSRMVSKYYKGKISDIVQKLCKEIEVSCETTSTTEEVKKVLPYDSPIGHIITLSKQARSSSNPKDVDFVFYQDIDGKFHFKPISEFKKKQKKWEYKVLLPHPQLTLKDAKYSVLKHGTKEYSPIQNALNGLYSSEIISFDSTTGDYFSKTHVYNEGKYTKISNKKITNNEPEFKNIANSGVAVRRFNKQRFLFDCSEKPAGYDEVGLQDDWVGDRMAAMQNTNQVILHFTAPGNSEMKVGDIIVFRRIPNEAIAEAEGSSFKEKDIFYSGKYLVTDITHDLVFKDGITKNSATAVYTMRVRAIKDSKGDEYA
jgi:hypothetical protein